MAKAIEFQGHRSWNAWAISLWIDNTREVYEYAQDALRETRKKYGENVQKWAEFAAIRIFSHYTYRSKFGLEHGARWNFRCVKDWVEAEIEDILRFEKRQGEI
jgi:predicted AAA+ superfamily ATPase